MPIGVSCPSCNGRLTVSSAQVNTDRVTPCPACGASLLVTATAAVAPEAKAASLLARAFSCPHCTRTIKIDPASCGREDPRAAREAYAAAWRRHHDLARAVRTAFP